MGKPYSDDLRERVVAAIEAGHTRAEVAELYNMALSTVGGFIRRKRETGSVSPDKFGGYKSYALEPHTDMVKELVAEQPDSTLAELKARLAKKKVKVSQSGISRFLHHIKLTFKKSIHAAEQDRPDVAAARKALRKEQPTLDPKHLVFIDETAATTKMTRLYGRAPQGKRLVDKVPHGHWKTTTFICGLRYDGVTAPFVLDGPMDGPHFLAYVEQILAPTLKKGQIVFLDNVSTHKVDGVEQAIEARGARAIFLPAYSPDLNPIEQLFARLKSFLRKMKARTVDELWRAISSFLKEVSKDECKAYLANSGYA
ncbi:MAG: IS630 family transposase [Methylocella sp.]